MTAGHALTGGTLNQQETGKVWWQLGGRWNRDGQVQLELCNDSATCKLAVNEGTMSLAGRGLARCARGLGRLAGGTDVEEGSES